MATKFSHFPELVALDKFHHLPGIMLLASCYGLYGEPGLLWGFVLPTVGVWHSVFCVNSVCHVWGSRRFATSDYSQNNAIVGLVAFGEGWHNNHHAFPWSARQGLKWWEVDISYMMLCGLQRVGIVWDLKVPTNAQITRVEEKSLCPKYQQRMHEKNAD